MPGRHATTERPASTGWRAMSAAVRASSSESTVNSVIVDRRAGVRELGYAYHRRYTKPIPGGTHSRVVHCQKQCLELRH